MGPIELKIRNLEDGQTGTATFASVDDAKAWLTERPAFLEVEGVVPPIDPTLEREMQGVMRPLDEKERARKDALYREQLEEVRRRNAEEQRQAVASQGGASLDSHAQVDSNAPMVVQYVRGRELRLVDPTDGRAIPAVVREAVEAWVAERDTWLHPRRQHVGSALVTVSPGDGHEADRVHPGGQFEAVPGLPE